MSFRRGSIPFVAPICKSLIDHVTIVGGYFDIDSNDGLASMQGLDHLTTVGGYLKIYRNDVLTSLQGLDHLASVGGT